MQFTLYKWIRFKKNQLFFSFQKLKSVLNTSSINLKSVRVTYIYIYNFSLTKMLFLFPVRDFFCAKDYHCLILIWRDLGK
jgi:hypothetical protein